MSKNKEQNQKVGNRAVAAAPLISPFETWMGGLTPKERPKRVQVREPRKPDESITQRQEEQDKALLDAVPDVNPPQSATGMDDARVERMLSVLIEVLQFMQQLNGLVEAFYGAWSVREGFFQVARILDFVEKRSLEIWAGLWSVFPREQFARMLAIAARENERAGPDNKMTSGSRRSSPPSTAPAAR